MTRRMIVVACVVAGSFGLPATASAQFGRPFGLGVSPYGLGMGPYGLGPGPFGLPGGIPNLPVIPTGINPLNFVPRYYSTTGIGVTGLNASFGIQQTTLSVNPPINPTPYLIPVIASYGQTGSYMTGGSHVKPNFVVAAQRNLARAQREAAAPAGAKAEIAGQWNYEKGSVRAREEPFPVVPDPIRIAIAPPDPAQISSGEALNTLLKEIIALEARGARGPSGYIHPLLLNNIVFAGGPAADLWNLARPGGSLKFPPVFDDPALAEVVAAVEQDFAAVAAAVQAGRNPERAPLRRLEVSFERLREAVNPRMKDLPFDDAIATRRFLNQLANAIRAMKSGLANGLIDSKWAAEGVVVADLTKHMAKHKLMFGPAPAGSDKTYATLHQLLAMYLFVLQQPRN
jgi:hypothetical protein